MLQMPEAQYVNSMVQTRKVNQSAWSSYHPLRQPLDEMNKEPEEIIPLIELRTLEVCLTGSRHRKVETGEQEAQVQGKIGALVADVTVEAENLLPETGEATSVSPPQMASIATSLDKTTRHLRVDEDLGEEMEGGDLGREESEVENELAGTEEMGKDTDWWVEDPGRLRKSSMQKWKTIGEVLGPAMELLLQMGLRPRLPLQLCRLVQLATMTST